MQSFVAHWLAVLHQLLEESHGIISRRWRLGEHDAPQRRDFTTNAILAPLHVRLRRWRRPCSPGLARLAKAEQEAKLATPKGADLKAKALDF